MTRGDCARTILSRRHDLAAKIASRVGIGTGRRELDHEAVRSDEDIETLLRHLAEAVARGRSAPLSHYVAWAGARCEPTGDRRLLRAIGVTAEILEACLPSPCGTDSREHLDEALAFIARNTGDPLAVDHADADDHAERYLEALLSSDFGRARSLAFSSLERGASLTELHERFFRPALARVGTMWSRGSVGVAEAHRVIETTELLMARAAAAAAAPARAGATGSIVLCAPRGELHELGLRMIADSLGLAGWDVSHLGASCPSARVLGEVRMRRPDVLAVSVSLDANVDPLRWLVEELRRDDVGSRTGLLVGGSVFERDARLVEELGADAFASDAETALAACCSLRGRVHAAAESSTPASA